MFIASLRISLRRTRENLRPTSAVAFGIVLAVAILATTVVYFEALRDVALARTLEPIEPSRLDVVITGNQTPVTSAGQDQLSNLVNRELIDSIDSFSSDKYMAAQSWTMLIDEPPLMVPIGECPCRPTGVATGPDDVPGVNSDGDPDPRGEGALLACDCRRVTFMTVPGLDDGSVTITEGAAPTITDTPSPPGEVMTIDALLDAENARIFGLEVGDSVPVAPFWDSNRQRVIVRVSGIYERANPGEAFWTIYDTRFQDRTSTLTFARFVIPETTFHEALGPYFPNMGAEYAWLLDINTGSIHATDTGTIRGAIRDGGALLQTTVDGFRIETDLAGRLADFEVDLFFNRIPMLIVLALVAAVALYYAAMVAAALLATQQSEIALMRSRGGTRLQIFAVYVIEASVLTLFAFAAGPFISMLIVSAIGTFPGFEELYNGEPLPVQLTRNVIGAAALGAIFGLLALLIPAFRATGLTVLSERRGRGRPGRLNVIQRYYLDLGLLGLVGLLLWQLSKQGSFVATDVFGETSVNNLTLAIPALLLVMAGFALLRLFPVIADLVSRVFASRIGSVVVPSGVFLGVRRLARNPAGQARLSLLLVLASALGVFAATFSSTLERNAREQVLYETGAEFRATGVLHGEGGRSVSGEEELHEIEGLATIAPVLRTNGTVDALISNSASEFTVLGVDSTTFGDVAWHREDFYGTSMNTLMEEIRPETPPGIRLPVDTWFISILIKSQVRREEVQIVGRLSDRNGRFYSVPMGDLTPRSTDRNRFNCETPVPDVEPDWCRLGSGIFPAPQQGISTLAPRTPGLTLHSIGFVSRSGDIPAGSILIDDITVINNTGMVSRVIEDFSDLSRFRTLEPSTDALGDTLEFDRAENGQFIEGIAEYRWTDTAMNEYRGLAFNQEAAPIPAIISESFAESRSASAGDVITVSIESARVNLRIVRTVVSFPTLNNDERPFIVADLDLIKERVNLARLNDLQPNEYWVNTEQVEGEDVVTAADIKEQLGGLSSGNAQRLSSGPVIDRDARLALVSLDPLVTKGWQALLAIAFASVLIVSATGYIVHARASFLERRSEMALLRTIGVSRVQIVMLVATEQLLVIGIAVLTGLFLGSRLGDTIFPFLAASGHTGSATPPMVVQFNPADLALVFGVMGCVVLSVMFAVIWFTSRTAIASVMRAGDG